MAIFKKTKRFEEALKKLGADYKIRLFSKLDRWEQMEDDQVLQSFGRRNFYPNFFVPDIDDLRIPIQIVKIQLRNSTPTIFFILDILTKEHPIYKKLEDNNQRHYREEYLKRFGIDNQTIEAITIELLEDEEKQKRKKKPPYWLLEWLNMKDHYIDNEKIWIYESFNWVEKTETKNFKETYWPKIYKILSEHIINADESYLDWNSELAKHIVKYPNLRVLNEGRVYIIYEYISLPKEREIYFLYDFIIDKKEDIKLANDSFILGLYKRENTNPADLSGYALRTYPDFILYDEEIWKMVETDQRANLSLSAEEREILLNASLPIFINGQAGSGKSTILYYLFASYIHKKMMSKTQPKGNPLFLTFNEKLVEVAKSNIGDLLKYHHHFVDKTSQIDDFEQILKKKLNESVLPYKKFLLHLAKREIGEDNRFNEAGFINFNRFRKLYIGTNLSQDEVKYRCLLRDKNEYSPELAWHVIQTYIKGYKVDQELTPDEYQAIPYKDKTVSFEKYSGIYNSIWLKWYKKLYEEYELWDQQDLTRAILQVLRRKDENDGKEEQYPVIICDETQDFTRIELELILRMNAFYGYDLSDLKEIPLAFAGDPLQTINPSGFRWEYLQSTFYSKFKELEFPVDIHVQDLTINFRSYPRIVKFGNLVQFLRQVIRDLKDLRYHLPQLNGIKTLEDDYPKVFEIDKNIDLHKIRKLFNEKNIFIVPTDYGGEQEYVNKHPEYFFASTEINNVYSPLRIKGMEFDKIVVLNFGDEFGDLLEGFLKGKKEEDEMIQLQYVFNKLYVAITRAKKDLYIIDTPKGVSKFWHFITKESYLKYYKKIEDPNIQSKWNEEMICSWTEGQVIIFETDLGKIANTIKARGEISQDPDEFIRAASYFRKINDIKNEKECLAQAYELEEKFKEAGIAWQDPILNEKVRASECFWKGMYWDELLVLHSSQKDLRYTVAKFMVELNHDNFLYHLTDLFEKNMHKKVEPNDITWKTVVKQIYNKLEALLNEGSFGNNSLKLDQLLNYFEKLSQKGFPEFYLLLGRYSYLMKRYQEAIDYWDKTNGYNEEDYNHAKFHVSNNINDKIFYAKRLNWEEKIVELWDEINFNTKGLSNDSIRIIKEAVKNVRSLDDSSYLNFLMTYFFTPEDFKEVFELYISKEIRDKNIERKIIDYLMKNNNWTEILEQYYEGSFLKSHFRYLLTKMVNIPNPSEEEIDFVLNHVSKLPISEIRDIIPKILEFYHNNKCYLRSFTKTINESMKNILLNKYLEIEYEKSKSGNDKKIKRVNINSSFLNTNIIYAVVASMLTNEEFYYSDRLSLLERVMDYATKNEQKSGEEWAKETWLYLQNAYIKWLQEKKEKETEKSEFKKLENLNKRELAQSEATIRREEQKLIDKKKEWHKNVPETLRECPITSDYIFSTNPFVVKPSDALINNFPNYYQLLYNGFEIKVFKADRRVQIVNDEKDIHIRISMKDFFVESMGLPVKTRKKNPTTKEFKSKDSYIIGTIYKNNFVELSVEKNLIKIDITLINNN